MGEPSYGGKGCRSARARSVRAFASQRSVMSLAALGSAVAETWREGRSHSSCGCGLANLYRSPVHLRVLLDRVETAGEGTDGPFTHLGRRPSETAIGKKTSAHVFLAARCTSTQGARSDLWCRSHPMAAPTSASKPGAGARPVRLARVAPALNYRRLTASSPSPRRHPVSAGPTGPDQTESARAPLR